MIPFRKGIAVLAASLTLTGFSAVAAKTPDTSSLDSSSAPSSSMQNECPKMHPGFGHHMAMDELSRITGISMEDLHDKYPQKTPWQIAKSMGKLEELKSAFLTQNKELLGKMEQEGKLTAEESKKVYEDLQTRVAAIDGTNVVILGAPKYKPEMKNQSGQGK